MPKEKTRASKESRKQPGKFHKNKKAKFWEKHLHEKVSDEDKSAALISVAASL